MIIDLYLYKTKRQFDQFGFFGWWFSDEIYGIVDVQYTSFQLNQLCLSFFLCFCLLVSNCGCGTKFQESKHKFWMRSLHLICFLFFGNDPFGTYFVVIGCRSFDISILINVSMIDTERCRLITTIKVKISNQIWNKNCQ